MKSHKTKHHGSFYHAKKDLSPEYRHRACKNTKMSKSESKNTSKSCKKYDKSTKSDINLQYKSSGFTFVQKFDHLVHDPLLKSTLYEVPIAFYIPECKSRDKYKQLIEDNGGIVINTLEPFMYQIKIEGEKSKNVYPGDIYSHKLIEASIRNKGIHKNLNKYKLGCNNLDMSKNKGKRIIGG